MNVLPISQIRALLIWHQRRLRAGDDLPSFKLLAAKAGVHRDTLYALIAGDKVSERSQNAISKALIEVMESHRNQPSRLLTIELSGGRPQLRLGSDRRNMFGNY
jgi:hypothetical protein